MALFRPTHLQSYLKKLGIRPKKSLSQNFLIDGNILKKMVQLGKIEEGDQVIEIGSGPGALTEVLLSQNVASLIALEKDTLFAKELQSRLLPYSQLKVLEIDALTFPYNTLPLSGKKKWKVVANIPYQITAPLLALLLPLHEVFSQLILMVQKEVALRLTAESGSSHFSRLTLLTKFYSDPKLAFTISPNCFYPRPKVHSAVVQLILRPPPFQVENKEAFFSMVQIAFSERRKTIATSLGKRFGKDYVLAALKELNLDPTLRPERLSLADFVALFFLF